MENTKDSLGMQTTNEAVPAKECFKGMCPFCLSEIDVYLDIKQRPYWRCWRCEVRTFGTKTALKALQLDGWIWKDERPFEELQAWLKRVAKAAGLGRKEKK